MISDPHPVSARHGLPTTRPHHLMAPVPAITLATRRTQLPDLTWSLPPNRTGVIDQCRNTYPRVMTPQSWCTLSKES